MAITIAGDHDYGYAKPSYRKMKGAIYMRNCPGTLHGSPPESRFDHDDEPVVRTSK